MRRSRPDLIEDWTADGQWKLYVLSKLVGILSLMYANREQIPKRRRIAKPNQLDLPAQTRRYLSTPSSETGAPG